MIFKEYFELLFPLLSITWAVFRIGSLTKLLEPSRQIDQAAALAISGLLTFYPFAGLSAANYLLSVNPNFSIGSIALIFVLLWEQLARKPLLSNQHLLEFLAWNVAVSICLFTCYLGFFKYDMYALGYGFSIWFVITAMLTVILFLRRHPLSYIFIAYIVSFDLKLLPSNNFFDYITDGALFFISLGLLLFYGVRYYKTRNHESGRQGRAGEKYREP